MVLLQNHHSAALANHYYLFHPPLFAFLPLILLAFLPDFLLQSLLALAPLFPLLLFQAFPLAVLLPEPHSSFLQISYFFLTKPRHRPTVLHHHLLSLISPHCCQNFLPQPYQHPYQHQHSHHYPHPYSRLQSCSYSHFQPRFHFQPHFPC